MFISFFVMLAAICMVIFVLVLPDNPTEALERRRNRRKELKGRAESEKAKAITKDRAEGFSYVGWQVVKSFEELPEASRPGVDIEATVKALDFKYNIDSINQHFPYYRVKNTNGRIICDCLTGAMYSGAFSDHKAKRNTSCVKFVEYAHLLHSFAEIRREISNREKALREQERAVRLAGMQSDLDNVDSIMEALKAEREAMREATSSIYKQTKEIE